jgi:flagellar hook-basal body complex protein FliE
MMNPISGVTADAIRPTLQAGTTAPADGSFAAMFAKVAASARDSLKAGEATSIKGISGEASVQSVVRAMMTAEQHLRAAIAVRDRVVAAYQEISRMQI